MKVFEINGTKREKVGKRATKDLRKEERVPCILYGGEENIHFSALGKDFLKLLYTPHVYLVKLIIDGKEYMSIIQDTQFHPVTEKILHIDFLQIFDDKKVKIGVPVQLNGLAKGVKAGGKLFQTLRYLKVKAFAADLPDILNVDVTNLAFGQSIKVEDLSFENMELIDPKDAVVAGVRTARAAVLDEDEDEEGEEGAEGEGEEGASEEKSESAE